MILVTGATGTVGCHVVDQLMQLGQPVRALTRNPEKANLPQGAQVVAGDLTNPETLWPALTNVTAMHLINFGGDDYAPLQTGNQIMAMAKQAGVQRVTLLLGSETGAFEQAIEASGLAWTHLQPVEFMAGLLDWAESIRTEGVVRTGFVHRRSAMIHEADIGAVAATVLTQDSHAGKTYTVTGREVLTPTDMVCTISQVLGRDIRLIELSEAQAREQWRQTGFPDDVIEFFVWAHGNTPPEGYTVVPTVEQITGRPPRALAQWVAENRSAFYRRSDNVS